jgi:alpha-aminoadipic semialdehyde synthase
MKKIIGIRREDKNQWEKRVPLIPADVKSLLEKNDLDVLVQPSEIRVFQDEEYERAGAKIDESLSSANVVFAVKEIPVQLLEAKKTYVVFSHTIKGQAYNMEMLKQLMNLKCNLIDYEKISNQQNARIITFSLFAGIAGIIETLYAFARKMELKGISTPFNTLKQAYQYRSITQAEEEITKISKKILKNGVSKELHPLTIGILGYGNVAKGVQRILELLPVKDLTPDQLKEGLNSRELDNKYVYKIVFEEKDLVEPDYGEFNLQDYYLHPEKYKSIFHHYLPEPKILLNCVFWTEDYPRIITRKNLKDSLSRNLEPGLQVIGDISCDIGGAIEITKDSTKPDNACYSYFIETDKFEDGIRRGGITVMAIDNLPCEFSQEASASFSSELMGYVNAIASADYSIDFQDLQLPVEVKKAVILLNGQLTPDYQYIADFI